MSYRDAVTTEIENELTLLSRYHVHAKRGGFQLDRSAYLLLGRLELEHPLSLKQLAEAFRLDISTINRQIAALLRLDLVERVLDPEGGIARKIEATALGLELLHADRNLGRAGIERVVAEWSDQDLNELSRLLAKFNRGIELLEGNPWPRTTPIR